MWAAQQEASARRGLLDAKKDASPGGRRILADAPAYNREMEALIHIVIYLFAGLYLVLAAGLAFAFYRTRHSGTLLMAVIYVAAAGAALGYRHWWPLIAGLLLTWALRLLGLEPRIDRNPE